MQLIAYSPGRRFQRSHSLNQISADGRFPLLGRLPIVFTFIPCEKSKLLIPCETPTRRKIRLLLRAIMSAKVCFHTVNLVCAYPSADCFFHLYFSQFREASHAGSKIFRQRTNQGGGGEWEQDGSKNSTDKQAEKS